MTDLINKVTIMMGNVMRILRDEKNFSAEREIRPKKLECNFADQKSWENGVLGEYNTSNMYIWFWTNQRLVNPFQSEGLEFN